MLDPAKIPPVACEEIVTRYLMNSRWYRADQTIKHEAFIPPNDLEFSVTRLREATEAELWDVGAQVAATRNKDLHGRTDLPVGCFVEWNLQVQADALPDNPNHAIVTDWPQNKARQMFIAKQLAARSGHRQQPPPPS